MESNFGSTEALFSTGKMRQVDIARCQIQEWYPRFRQVSIKTIIHPLPETFVQFLLHDGSLFLPKSTTDQDAFPNRVQITCPELQAEDYGTWSEEEEEEKEQEESDSDDADSQSTPSFPELETQVMDSIKTLGGFVFPKLNWSAPKDTAWISTNGTLKCSSFSDIVLLLKASDSLVHDLCHAFDSCEDKSCSRPEQFFLALRKWYDLRPEMEFRVFVKGGILVGVSQREITGFYPALLAKKDDILSLILQFFVEEISGKFGGYGYAFDCYITRDGRVKLLDFSPWRAFTLPLLFSWEELERNHELALGRVREFGVLEEDLGRLSIVEENEAEWNNKLRNCGYEVDFRIVESEGCVQPSLQSSSGVPYDYVDMSAGSPWDEFLRKADEEIRKQSTVPAAGA